MQSSPGSDHPPPLLAIHSAEYQSLLEQVHRLTHEVQRLVRIESRLYGVQKRMDKQVRHYRAMNEVGRQLNKSLDLQSALNVIVEFVLYNINLERCLILFTDQSDQYFRVQALDGYYENPLYPQIANLAIPASQLVLKDLDLEAGYVVCSATCAVEALVSLRSMLLMHEYILFPLGETQDTPQCLLIAGNSQAMMPYQTQMDIESDLILCLINFANQASAAVKKAIFYDTLQCQKHELENALLALHRKNIRLEQALQALDEAHIKATQDSLTGLFNRAYFDERFQQEFTQAQLKNRDLALALLDLDFFKSINDSYGHLVGDLVLQQFGKLLQEHAPISSIPCRYGGEEFAIILPDSAPDRVHAQMDEIRCCFQQQVLVIGQQRVCTTLSAGIALSGPTTQTEQQLLKQADQALYAAKTQGRNRIVSYHEPWANSQASPLNPPTT